MADHIAAATLGVQGCVRYVMHSAACLHDHLGVKS